LTVLAGGLPKWISDLGRHRYLGLDFILISQHPALIDLYVRWLVDRHVHTVRKFGAQWVERWSWAEVQPDPASRMSQRSVERKTRHRFSKAATQAYTSAELHTVKRRIPPFLMIGAAPVVIVPLLGWAAVRILHSAQRKAIPQAAAKIAGKGTDMPPSSLLVPMTKAQWIAQRVPPVPGVS